MARVAYVLCNQYPICKQVTKIRIKKGFNKQWVTCKLCKHTWESTAA